MPIYQYRCDACGRDFEKREGFDAPTVTTCVCDQGATARRRISKPAIVFKGSGFYITDSRGGGSSGSSDSSDKPAASESSSTPEAKPSSDSPAPAPTASPAPTAPASSGD
jgi:putative FmdB family regulatory protein